MSVFRDRVKSKKSQKKKGHKRRATNRAKRGALMEWSWDDIKRKEEGQREHEERLARQHREEEEAYQRQYEEDLIQRAYEEDQELEEEK